MPLTRSFVVDGVGSGTQILQENMIFKHPSTQILKENTMNKCPFYQVFGVASATTWHGCSEEAQQKLLEKYTKFNRNLGLVSKKSLIDYNHSLLYYI
jgi:hypothetical protein